MLNRLSRDLNEITENEQIINSEECSELETTSAALMFSNGHNITIIDTSMMDNTLQDRSIYYYFSSNFEVRVLGT